MQLERVESSCERGLAKSFRPCYPTGCIINDILILMQSTQQHSEMDEDFKRYLEDKGLKQLQTLKTAVSAVVGILSEY